MSNQCEHGALARVCLLCEAAAEITRLRALADRLRALADRLKLEAQIHAQEARTANATIAEIYQCVTEGKGEPGNFHGANPVRDELTRLRAEIYRLTTPGYVLVPVEPTEDMLFAAEQSQVRGYRELYAAMLAAIPTLKEPT